MVKVNFIKQIVSKIFEEKSHLIVHEQYPYRLHVCMIVMLRCPLRNLEMEMHPERQTHPGAARSMRGLRIRMGIVGDF